MSTNASKLQGYVILRPGGEIYSNMIFESAIEAYDFLFDAFGGRLPESLAKRYVIVPATLHAEDPRFSGVTADAIANRNL